MYESHFGLVRRPFLSTPEPDCWFPGRSIQESFDALSQCLDRGQGLAVLTAPPGTGKTLLCRKLAREFGSVSATITLPHGQFSTAKSLLQSILYELEHPYLQMDEEELRLELVDSLRKLRPNRGFLTLLLDEAHLLEPPVLEEIRTLMTVDEDGAPAIRVLLAGQLALEEQLARPECAGLNQRVACQAVLEPLTRAESADYVAFRLQWAGGDVENIIAPDALQLIARVSDGLPRCLNQLSDHCLLMAAMAEESLVSERIVHEALEDLKHLPLPWNLPAELEPGTEPIFEEIRESGPHDASGGSDEGPPRPDEGDPAGEAGRAEKPSPDDGSPQTGEEDSMPDAPPDDAEMCSIEVGVETDRERNADGDSRRHRADETQKTSSFEPESAAVESSWAPESGRDDPSPWGETGSFDKPDQASIDKADGLTEEPVVDPYAAMDAGRPWSDERPVTDPRPVARASADDDRARSGRGTTEAFAEPRKGAGSTPDEGRPGPSPPRLSDDPGPPSDSEPETGAREARDGSTGAEEALAAVEDDLVLDFQDSPGPQALVDRITPLLDQAISTDMGPLPIESADAHSTGETPAPDPRATLDAPSQFVGWTNETIDRTLEKQIGAEVLDIGLEARQAVEQIVSGPPAAEFPAGPAPSASLPEDRSAVPRPSHVDPFDVVQPEDETGHPRAASTASNRSGSSAERAGETGPDRDERIRQYGLLFSRLRRQRGAR